MLRGSRVLRSEVWHMGSRDYGTRGVPSCPIRRSSRTAAERVASNARIAAAREVCEPWKSIAQREGISVKQARRGRDEHLASAAASPEPLPPLEVGALVERAIRVQLLALDHLERLARTGPNDSAQVGAATGLSSVGVTLVALLARLGSSAPRWMSGSRMSCGCSPGRSSSSPRSMGCPVRP